jgi:hypothetical protein
MRRPAQRSASVPSRIAGPVLTQRFKGGYGEHLAQPRRSGTRQIPQSKSHAADRPSGLLLYGFTASQGMMAAFALLAARFWSDSVKR